MKGLSKIIYGLGIFLLLATDPKIAVAQSERGTIRGTVTDATGAVVIGATVKAINPETGVESSTVTTAAGFYSIPQLKPGIYRVEVEQASFKKSVRQNVTVNVAATVGLDFQLELGELTQEVSVTASAPQLKSETSEVSTAINPKTFNDLPLPVAGGRSAESFIFLAPGTTGNTFDAHINGSQTLSKEIQFEGLSMTIAEVGGDPRVVTLPPDALQEFSIATGTYSAEFGNTGGGIERFTIKSGTNKLHGNLYEFLGNDKFDARGFFQADRSIRRQNEFGGSAGGPIKKNKTFFFFNINYYKFRSGPSNQVASVPTAAFKRGDLSELKNPDGSLIQIYDPNSTRPDGHGGFTRDPFPGNIIPSDRISAVSKNILGYVPDPKTAGIVNNYPASGNSRNDNHNYTIKIDHRVNANHSISFAWNDGLNTDNGPVAPLPLPIANTRDGVKGPAQKTLRLSYDWVISPTTVNHLAGGLTRQYQRLESPNQGQDWPNKLGLTGTANGAFPFVQFGTSGIDIGTTSFTNWGQNQELLITVSNTFLLSDSLSMVKGKHNLKMGVDARKLQNNLSVPSTSGAFVFDHNETALPSARATTGNGFASFLLGAVDNGSYSINDVTKGMRYPYFAAYFQDDIKLRPNFTLNMGLRWDYLPTMVEVNDVYSIMDPTVPNPAAGGRPGALIYAGDGPGRTGRRRLTNGISYNNWGPRIGLAWQPKHHMVIRTGYGISYYPTGAQGGGNAKPQSFGFTATPTFFSQDVGLTPAFYWDNGFPQNYDRPPFIDPGFGVGGPTSYWNENAKEPTYRQDWNFGTQYQLAENLLLDIAYVGAKSTRLSTGVFNLNQVDSKYLSLGNLLTQPIDDPAVVAAGFAPPYPGFSGSLAQALRPFPQYSGIGTTNSANMGNSTYNSLQMKVEKRFSNGLFLLSSYTWSKTLTDASSALSGFFSTSARDQYNRRLEKALAFSDVPSRLVVAFNYELPIGPGKPHANVTGVAGKILGGWQINGIMSYQSGTPISAGVNNNLPLFNDRNLPNVVPGVNPKFDTSNFDPAQDLYLNVKAFAEPAPFTYGNAASILNVRTFPSYNEDFGIMKRTVIHEDMNIEFRFEMFNAFNRHIFGAPSSNVSDPFSFGKITSASGGRQGQFALKFNF
jgi:Carboxypeptidase regulatory-like domain